MKYLVLSDIHGDRNYLNRVLAQVPDIKNIIFLGDGLSEMLDVKRQNPEYNITAVTGNCDFLKDVPSQEILNINGYRVLVCHGDGYYVKMGLLPIKKACRELKPMLPFSATLTGRITNMTTGFTCLTRAALQFPRQPLQPVTE